MTATVGVHEAKTHLSRLLERVHCGEEVIITRSGTPIARLVPFEQPRKPRVPGIDAGKIIIMPDFDEPLPGWETFYE
jgi:prevent-host-death family protein